MMLCFLHSLTSKETVMIAFDLRDDLGWARFKDRRGFSQHGGTNKLQKSLDRFVEPITRFIKIPWKLFPLQILHVDSIYFLVILTGHSSGGMTQLYREDSLGASIWDGLSCMTSRRLHITCLISALMWSHKLHILTPLHSSPPPGFTRRLSSVPRISWPHPCCRRSQDMFLHLKSF
jgi:hypothetical protein